ncbi:MAG: DUF4231 domain-containing protein [Chromatiaceae bacterium]|nr:DUF4231 domain-containing protein [Chromatiaceae bacterium]
MTEARVPYQRLEDQIAWFDRRSSHHQRWYRRLKVLSIAAAALVPLVSGLGGYAFLAGALGVVVVVVEGLLHINQHYDHWIRYRATCESLRREKYLYLAGSARYAGLLEEAAFQQLAANVEAILAREGDDWIATLRSQDERQADGG